MFSPKVHRIFYLLGISIIVVGLPLSPAMMSIGQIIVFVTWLLEGNFTAKFSRLKSSIPALLILGFFLMHILWLGLSSDYSYGLHDIKIKLPLLALPLTICSGLTLNKKELHLILSLFVSAICIAAIICLFKLGGFIGEPVTDRREMSFIISHIRFGLMVCFAILISLFFSFQKNDRLSLKIIWGAVGLLLILFLGVLSSITALLILGTIGTVLLLDYSRKYGSSATFVATACTIFLILGYAGYSIFSIYDKQFKIEEYPSIELETKTPYGNLYYHVPQSRSVENGHYVYRYISEIEVEEAWTKRSKVVWHEKEIKNTLYRFLSSKGLRKDKNGINALSNQEVKAIENGIPNVDLMGKSSLYKRIHQTCWEIGNYRLGIPVGGSSLTMRFQFWKAAVQIVSENLWFGVGTGDVKKAFEKTYDHYDFGLGEKYRKRSHNQYLTFMITFGLVGFIYFLFSIYYPLVIEQHYLAYVFFSIVLLSYLNEDTLETQAGVTFFAGFFALFESFRLTNLGSKHA